MTVTKIEIFKAWLYNRCNLEAVKPSDYLNRKARKQILKQQKNNNKNEY